jgi:hypothetical protein
VTGILEGNAFMIVGVLCVLFVVGCAVKMRRISLVIIAAIGALGVYSLGHLNHAIAMGERLKTDSAQWLENAGIIVSVVAAIGLTLVSKINKRWPLEQHMQQRRSHVHVRAPR